MTGRRALNPLNDPLLLNGESRHHDHDQKSSEENPESEADGPSGARN